MCRRDPLGVLLSRLGGVQRARTLTIRGARRRAPEARRAPVAQARAAGGRPVCRPSRRACGPVPRRRRMQQHRAERHAAAPYRGDQAEAGFFRVAGLDADRPRIAVDEQRVVVTSSISCSGGGKGSSIRAARSSAEPAVASIACRQLREVARTSRRWLIEARRRRIVGAIHDAERCGVRSSARRSRDEPATWTASSFAASLAEAAASRRAACERAACARPAGTQPRPADVIARARRSGRFLSRVCSATISAVIIFVRLAIPQMLVGPAPRAPPRCGRRTAARRAAGVRQRDVRVGAGRRAT